MNKEFNGERLKEARIYCGITVADLAKKLGCQRQTVSNYENGKSSPTVDFVINNIARTLEFPPKYFMEKKTNVAIGSTYFRALLTTNKMYRAEQIQKMEIVAEIYNFLRDYIVFPELDIIEAESKNPEEAAMALREKWGLSDKPIENIIHVVEEHGILVTSFSTNTDDIDAFSQMVKVDNNITYLIGYSNNKTSASRIHFDIAHELGHICLHEWSEDIEMLEREEFKEREKEANRFAAAFLLPRESFIDDLKEHKLNIPYYTELKKKWKVSIQAMNRRAYNLGIISSDEYQMMIRTLQRRGMRKEEPLDDVLLTAGPSLLKTSVLMLLNEGVFTPKDFVDELSFSYNLSLSSKQIEYLIDLPQGTLEPPKVLQFPTLKLK